MSRVERVRAADVRLRARRGAAGYVTPDGRFAVEPAFSSWIDGRGVERHSRDGWTVAETSGGLVFDRGRVQRKPAYATTSAATLELARVAIADALNGELRELRRQAREVERGGL